MYKNIKNEIIRKFTELAKNQIKFRIKKTV